MQVSIVIPTRNRPASLQRCIDALVVSVECASTKPDIHVVDDCSSPALAARNNALCTLPFIQFHQLRVNRGVAAARNEGARACKGDWIAFIDDDIAVDADWFAQLLRTIEHADEHTIGIEGFVRGSEKGIWDKEVENLTGKLYPTCNIAYRAVTFQKAAGLDEHFKMPYHEDHELAARMLQHGDILFVPKIKVTHLSRNVKLLSYIFSAPRRMSDLLHAELYFFLKQRDRYHLFRYAQSFWRTYIAIATRHLYTTLHRRNKSNLIKHPLQTLTLIAATSIEQLVSVFLFPALLKNYLTQSPATILPFINVQATAILWKSSESRILSLLKLSRTPLRLALFALAGKPVYNAANTLIKLKKSAIQAAPSLRLFLRIDDVFFNDTKHIGIFIQTMRQMGIPFLAAVRGDDFLLPEASVQVNALVECGATLGLHGFSHTGRFGPFDSEILQMSWPQIHNALQNVKAAPAYESRKILAFVPPFNAINAFQISMLSQHFPVICTGPETMRFTQQLFGPLILKNGSMYFPSLFPFYGDCRTMCSFLASHHQHLAGDICVTIHMAPECVDNCRPLKALSSFRSLFHSWDELAVTKVRSV